MSEPQYIKCPYCSKTFNYNEPHLEHCYGVTLAEKKIKVILNLN